MNRPVAAGAFAGMLLAAQARVNGGLAERLGSPVVAALVSFAVGTAALAVAFAARRRPVRIARPARAWWFLGGLGGAFLVSSSAAAVPQIGVALLGVCLVAGQTAGGLVVDRLGLSPRGPQPLSRHRVGGAALAVAALVLAAGGLRGNASAGLFVILVLAGFGVALQQAANGHLQQATGDPVFAALVSFSVGLASLAVVTAAVSGGLDPLHWPPPSPLYLGGLGGAAYVALAAAVVGRLGVLRLTLASVAGQLLGAVALDAFAPAGRELDVGTLAAAGVTLLAVGVASRG